MGEARRISPRKLGAAAALAALLACQGLSACGGKDSVTDPVPDQEDGIRFADSKIVLDAIDYSDKGCGEVLPAGFHNIDSVPAGSAAVVKVTSTACYAAHIDIVDTAGAAIVSLDRYFDIYGRSDEDKNRGVDGFLAWDGLAADGKPVARTKYRWRIRFDLGGGNVFKYYGPVWLD